VEVPVPTRFRTLSYDPQFHGFYNSYAYCNYNFCIDVCTTDGPGCYSLKMTVTGSGSVGSSPAGIDCGTTCTGSLAQGTSVTLAATPATGYNFSDWGGA